MKTLAVLALLVAGRADAVGAAVSMKQVGLSRISATILVGGIDAVAASSATVELDGPGTDLDVVSTLNWTGRQGAQLSNHRALVRTLNVPRVGLWVVRVKDEGGRIIATAEVVVR